MSTGPITLTFPDVTDDVANVYAEDLQRALEDTLTGSDRVERRRTRQDSQDFGATLVLVLGTTAVTAIAEGIKVWLARNSGAARPSRHSLPLSRPHTASSPMAGEAVTAPTTLAILLGGSTWPKSPQLAASKAFASSARGFRQYLTDPSGFGLPDANVLDLFDSSKTAPEIVEEIQNYLRLRMSGTPSPRDLFL